MVRIVKMALVLIITWHNKEHGARSRYRQSIANLHFNSSKELELPRGNRVEGGLSGRSERS